MVAPLKLERRSKAIRDAENTKSLLAGATQIAIKNEEITRNRVDGLEKWADGVARLLGRGFWGRLTWFLFGR